MLIANYLHPLYLLFNRTVLIQEVFAFKRKAVYMLYLRIRIYK